MLAVVVVGLLVVLVPQLVKGDPGEPHLFIVWVVVMLVSCVPMTLSSVYKEKALGETEIDVVYLNGWVALFQVCRPSRHTTCSVVYVHSFS